VVTGDVKVVVQQIVVMEYGLKSASPIYKVDKPIHIIVYSTVNE